MKSINQVVRESFLHDHQIKVTVNGAKYDLIPMNVEETLGTLILVGKTVDTGEVKKFPVSTVDYIYETDIVIPTEIRATEEYQNARCLVSEFLPPLKFSDQSVAQQMKNEQATEVMSGTLFNPVTFHEPTMEHLKQLPDNLAPEPNYRFRTALYASGVVIVLVASVTFASNFLFR